MARSIPTRLVCFAHGQESGPWGRKITALAAVAEARGFAVESPDYSHTRDPDERVQHLLAHDPRATEQLVLVGSSMGGYVSAIASTSLRPHGLFLIAPAFYMPGYTAEPMIQARHISIVHGWRDDVVPVDHSVRFAGTHRAELHLLDGDHSLTDCLPAVERLFAGFLDDIRGSG